MRPARTGRPSTPSRTRTENLRLKRTLLFTIELRELGCGATSRTRTDRAYETQGVTRHPHWRCCAALSCAGRDRTYGASVQSRGGLPTDPRASSCSTRVRTWNRRRNRAPLCRLSHRASVGPRGVEPRPAGLQPAAPPATLRSLIVLGCCVWSARRDSNPRSTVCQTAALPLRHEPFCCVDQGGFEPPTSSSSARRPHRTGLLVVVVRRAGGTRTHDSLVPNQVGWPLPYYSLSNCVAAYPPPESNRDVRRHGGLSSARIPVFARRAWNE